METQSPKMPAAAETNRPAIVAMKIGVSVLLIMHLTAVFIFPFAFATNFESPAAMPIVDVARPYATAMHLNHGYAFFAPNPGPSHLIRYKVEFADGRPPIERMFPDIQRHWPRLLYHRHFMLAEHLHANYIPPQPPPQASDEDRRRWRTRRDLYEKYWSAFEDHLLETYQADKVTMVRIEHGIPNPDQFERVQRLDEESSFVPLDEPRTRNRGAGQ